MSFSYNSSKLFTIFDQRFNKLFGELKSRGVEIHARSIFLQGLLFIPPDELPERFHPIRESVVKLRELSELNKTPLSALFLNHAVMQKDIDKVV